MKVNFKSQHRSTGKNNPATKGQKRFSYTVTGTKEELVDFKKSQGTFYVEDEAGVPILNSPRDLGKQANMVKRQSDGRWVPVVDEKSVAIENLAGLATKFPMFAAQFGTEAAAIAVREESRISAPATVSASAETAKL